MTDSPDPESMIEAAQKAAAAGEYSAAEQLLRDAAALQEASLGESHPDLASTLNNLAFVCERLDKFDEAERGYRRAHKIAVASLSPGHPLIATSLKNLLEFCASRDIPIWTPPLQPTEETPLDDFASEPSEVDAAPDVESEPSEVVGAPDVEPERPVVTSRARPLMIGLAAFVMTAIVVVMVPRQGRAPAPAEVPRPVPQAAQPSSPVATSPAETIPSPPPPERQPAAATELPRTTERPRAAEQPRPTSSAAPTVLKAQLCRAIQKRGTPDWQCSPVDGDQRPGAFSFYTRLEATSATTVEHRWYYGGRVHQAMRLRVPPSPGSGYRTFSSNSVSAERAGEWKVELRALDGTVLHEERFVVR
jgi:hypothetical protein